MKANLTQNSDVGKFSQMDSIPEFEGGFLDDQDTLI